MKLHLVFTVLVLVLALPACSTATTAARSEPQAVKKVEPPPPPPAGESVICPADVKQCVDGSFVSRTAPACAFAACPGGTGK